MSLSATPAVRRAASTAAIAVAAAAWASRTLARLSVTPTWTSATSGTVVTRPRPLTLIVCSGVVVAGSTARAPGGMRAGPKATAAARPANAPAASQPRRGRATELVSDVMVGLLQAGCRAAGNGSGPLTSRVGARFPVSERERVDLLRVDAERGDRGGQVRCR